MDELDKKAAEEGDIHNEKAEYVPKYTLTGILMVFKTLIYMSPPLSAFIDYIVLLF
jgi:hypothetical protein